MPCASQTLQAFSNSLCTMFRRHGLLNLMCAALGVANKSLGFSPLPRGTNSEFKKENRTQFWPNHSKELRYFHISASVPLMITVVVVWQCTCQPISLMVANLEDICTDDITNRKITCMRAIACSNEQNSIWIVSCFSCFDAKIMSVTCEREMMCFVM